LLARGDHATRRVEVVLHRACDAASEVIESLVHLKGRAQHLFMGRSGNGARVEPRSHHRHRS
jgi:hypothetical protein